MGQDLLCQGVVTPNKSVSMRMWDGGICETSKLTWLRVPMTPWSSASTPPRMPVSVPDTGICINVNLTGQAGLV